MIPEQHQWAMNSQPVAVSAAEDAANGKGGKGGQDEDPSIAEGMPYDENQAAMQHPAYMGAQQQPFNP